MAIKKAAPEEAAQYDSYVVVYLTVFIAFFAFSFKFPRSGLVQRWRGAPAERSEDRVPPRCWASVLFMSR